jgi:hypothetical protein
MKNQKDRILDTPGEANRDKHINFLAEERGDEDIFGANEISNNDVENSATVQVDNGFFSTNDESENEDNDLFKKAGSDEDSGKGLAGTHDLS